MEINKIKTLLQINDAKYDALIETLIPIIENDVVNYTNNFKNGNKVCITTSAIFSSLNNSIQVENKFLDGQMIYIQNTQLNDGVYTIETATASSLSINTLYSIKDESINETIYIYPLVIPRELEMVIALMVNYKMQNKPFNVRSESMGDYSISYNNSSDENINGYSKEIMKALNKYRKLRW